MKYYAEKKFEDGRPMLYLNGKKVAPMIYSLSDFHAADPMTSYAQKNIKAFGKKGINIVQTSIFLHKTWHKITPFSIEYLKGELRAIINANPNVGIILRLHLSPPYWWLRDNPKEICVFGKEGPYRDNGEDSERLIKDDAENFMRVSLASEKWKKEASQQIVTMLKQISQFEESDHLVGIQVACGVYGEWHQWGFFGYHPDYSQPMTTFFRKFLKQKYKTDKNLQEAWQNDNVKLSTAQLAPYESRYFDQSVSYRDPKQERWAIDSLNALHRSISEAIIHFCKAIKENWSRPILTGTFYGYIDAWYHASVGGHLDAEYLSKSKYVDYWAAPFMYHSLVRNPGGVTVSRGVLESLRLNGVLWLTEMDSAPLGTENFVGGDRSRYDESIALLKRNSIEPFTRGMGMWFFDHRIFTFLSSAKSNGSIYEKYGWWDSPVLMNEIGKLKKICDKWAVKPYTPVADVLIVHDNKYLIYSPCNSVMHGDTYADWYFALGKSGVAYDSVYLHDIDKVDFSRYRCVIFYSTVRISKEERQVIHDKVFNSGRHIVWINNSGYMDDENKSCHLIEDITGIKVRRRNQCDDMQFVMLSNEKVHAVGGFSEQFCIEDNDSETIAIFLDGQVCAAKKHMQNYTSWQFMLPPSNANFLRELFRLIGVHVYSDGGESILVGGGLVVVTTEGEQTVKIKFANGKYISEKTNKAETIIFDAKKGVRIG